MNEKIALLSISLIHFGWSFVLEPRCFFPDGSIDEKGFVCNLTALTTGESASSCCEMFDQCYENGYCYQDWSNRFYRQSCTDATYRDERCGTQCLQQPTLGSPGYIQPCSWQNQTGCCETDGAQSCCGNSSALFSWKPSYIKTVIDSNGQNRLAYALPGTISGTITATAVPVQTTPGALYHDAYATVTVSGASTGTATNAALRTGAQQQSDTNVGVIVVSGVLGPVCCVLIVAIVWALRRYNRERHTRQDVEKRYQTLRTLSTEKMTRSTMRSSPCPPELVQRCSTVPELDPDAGILEAHE